MALALVGGLIALAAGARGARAEEAARRPSAWRGWSPTEAGVEAEHDPIQGVNRPLFWFNDHVDMWVLAPVATGWENITPVRVRTCIRNFFNNLRFPIVAVNDLLQGKVVASASDVGRFAVNTTVGVAGFFDPAAHWGLARHDEDFGQTLGRWGVPQGPYLVIPLLGPSTVRDASGLIVDYGLSVVPFFVDQVILLGARVFDGVNERSFYLKEVKSAKESSLDYYAFVRNAYLQRRRALVADQVEQGGQENENDLYYPQTEGSQ
jgi:phospholipid-binding lipoprotein MlaA